MSALANNVEQELIEKIASFEFDPEGYVWYAYPWGEPGELEDETPRDWQLEVLRNIREGLLAGKDFDQVVQEAVASGHGIGKSALVAWITGWSMSTREDTRGVVTANTDTQLRTKTWPEMAKWHRLSINSHWFTLTATAMFSAEKGKEKNWRIDIVPWSETNTEAFAGLHNKGKRILIIFDEASAIPDKIWEVTEGATTDENTQIIWCVFGNPTRTTGRFRDCFGKYGHRWNTKNIDSRTVPGTNKTQIQKWVEDNGEDSDFVRIRVRGEFPRASSMQFIETDVVAEARKREPIAGLRDPLIMSVDVARGGEDRFVIGYRRGMDAKSIPPIVIPGYEARDSMKMVTKVSDLATTTDQTRRPDAIIVDETGVGGPIVDRLRQILGDNAQVYGVNFASGSPDRKLANMRTYMWWRMRDWLRGGGSIPDMPEFESDLCGTEYTHDKHDRLILESKDQIKARSLPSPDLGDMLAISFAFNIQPREETYVSGNVGVVETEYDPLDGL